MHVVGFFIAASVRIGRVMGQFSILLFAYCKMRLHETAKYFPFNTISFLMPDFWLEVSIRKVLRPATSTQVFLGFSLSISEC
jgi:hypothetical protein